MEYGIQMYSVRDLTKESLDEALRQVAELGYKFVEFAGFFGHTAEEVKGMLDKYGLKVSGTHTGWQEVAEHFEETVAFHKAIGNKNIIIPGADLGNQEKLDAFIKMANEFQPKLAAEGINVDWVVKYNIGEDSSCEDANIELAEEGCELIINNSYGFEDYMLKVAPDYEDVQFVACTNLNSSFSELKNVHNAFANIYEGRYLAGVVGGLKLQEMIDAGDITADQAVIGYVGAFPYA